MTNLQDGWTVKDLTEGEAIAIFAVLTGQQRLVTRLWTEGWPGWRQLDAPECHFLFQTRPNTQEPPPITTEAPQPVEITQVMIPKGPGSDQGYAARKHQRFAAQIPVTVQTVAEKFETVTEDVSEGGIRLRDPLPDKFAGYCQIVFQPRTNQAFVCLASPVEDQKGGRVHLEFVDSEDQWQFIEWLRAQDWAKVS